MLKMGECGCGWLGWYVRGLIFRGCPWCDCASVCAQHGECGFGCLGWAVRGWVYEWVWHIVRSCTCKWRGVAAHCHAGTCGMCARSRLAAQLDLSFSLLTVPTAAPNQFACLPLTLPVHLVPHMPCVLLCTSAGSCSQTMRQSRAAACATGPASLWQSAPKLTSSQSHPLSTGPPTSSSPIPGCSRKQ
jgi:hypothetical protein